MPETFPRGRFVWHELMTTDPDAAIGFYSKVVGWAATVRQAQARAQRRRRR